MRQIIPFRKDIHFNTKISEITSISLEHTLNLTQDNYVAGEFIVSGDYKITKVSVNREQFTYNLPFDIHLDSLYNLNNFKVDIDDFYYEIINDEILRVNIDVLVDGIEFIEKKEEVVINHPTVEPPKIEENFLFENIEVKDETQKIESEEEKMKINDDIYSRHEEDLFKQEETAIPVNITANTQINLDSQINDNKIKSLFDSFDDKDETFTTYHIHIVRKEDTVETIMAKYSISREDLLLYNKLEDLKLGDKIIVPAIKNE